MACKNSNPVPSRFGLHIHSLTGSGVFAGGCEVFKAFGAMINCWWGFENKALECMQPRFRENKAG